MRDEQVEAMRLRTVVLLELVLAGLASVLTVGLTAGERVTPTETGVSDTTRENEVNHRAVGVDSDGGGVATVAAVVNTEPIGPTSCSLVRLDATGDGAAEIFVRYGDGRVVRLDGAS